MLVNVIPLTWQLFKLRMNLDHSMIPLKHALRKNTAETSRLVLGPPAIGPG